MRREIVQRFKFECEVRYMSHDSVYYRYESPRIRKRSARGKWELVCVRKSASGDTRTITSLTDIPCSARDRSGERLARAALDKWMEELRAAEDDRQRARERGLALEDLNMARRANLELTLAEYGELFNQRRLSRGEVERSTAADWNSDFTRYCLSALPDGIRVCDVTADDVTKMIDTLIHERGLAAATARRGFLALNQLLKEASSVDGLPINPCAAMKAPKKGRPRQNPLSIRKAGMLVDMLSGMSTTKTVFSALCALLFGISEGEVCGLRIRDLDLDDTHSVLIRTAIGHDGSVDYEKDPKTRARRRRVYLTPTMISIFRRRLEEIRAECRRAGLPYSEDLFLVGRPDGSFWSPKCLSKSWGQMSDTLGLKGLEGLKLTYHDLRHTFATCANAAGVDVNTIAAIMGHSTTQVTMMVYISVDPEESTRALLKLESKLNLSEGMPAGSASGDESVERRAAAMKMFGLSVLGGGRTPREEGRGDEGNSLWAARPGLAINFGMRA